MSKEKVKYSRWTEGMRFFKHVKSVVTMSNTESGSFRACRVSASDVMVWVWRLEW